MSKAPSHHFTQLATGERREKSEPLMEAIGTIDELDAQIGNARVLLAPAFFDMFEKLSTIQQQLYVINAELAGAENVQLSDEALADLSAYRAQLEAQLPPLDQFLIPGRTPAEAALHIARTVCRRAERALVRISAVERLRSELTDYFNRLSSVLFACARSV